MASRSETIRHELRLVAYRARDPALLEQDLGSTTTGAPFYTAQALRLSPAPEPRF